MAGTAHFVVKPIILRGKPDKDYFQPVVKISGKMS
jgi:hypothetical protein